MPSEYMRLRFWMTSEYPGGEARLGVKDDRASMLHLVAAELVLYERVFVQGHDLN